ncbi:MAG: hypothetical protein WBM24_20765 [Candidatus Sulfotelmatobacter sp.]
MTIQFLEDVPIYSLQPRNIRLYLRTRGWVRADDSQTTPDIWELVTGEGIFEVIAPSSQDARDFPITMRELLRTISIIEDRAPIEVVRDLVTLSFDVQYIHCDYEGPSGTAPLRDAVDIYKAAYGMFTAAAVTLEDPHLVLPQRRPPQTSDLLRKVLAGPTTAGSYVVSLWTPIPPRLTPEEDSVLFEMEEDDPYERVATQHLHSALSATRAAVGQILTTDDGLDAFVERERQGVSANLCESLVTLSGESGTPFDIRFAWALDRPVVGPKETVPFTGESLPVLKEAARELRARLPEDDVRIRGNVIRLHREGNLGSAEVTVAGSIVGDADGKLRRVTISLAESDYEEAIAAHRSYEEVEMLGSLLQRGNRTYLLQAREFIRHAELA